MAEFDKSRDYATVHGAMADGSIYVQDGRRFNAQFEDVTVDPPSDEQAQTESKEAKPKAKPKAKTADDQPIEPVIDDIV